MKIYLAGIEGRIEQVEQVGGTRYGLTTFHYLRDKQDDVIRRIRNLIHREWLIDSGAFTFMNSGGAVDWVEYVDDYVEFINRYDIELFIELDLYSIIGMKETEKLRNRLELKTKKQCMPVFHPELGIDYYKKLVANYSYISLGGIVVGKWKNIQQMIPLINYANQRDVKVHGLGFTRVKELEYMNFHSVDSTSWIAERFGQVHTFNGRSMRQIKLGNRGRKLDWRKASLVNIQQWNLYQQYMDGRA